MVSCLYDVMILVLILRAINMLEERETCKTLSVPTAGRLYYGLSRNASYSAVKRGDIPVIRVGRMLRVPVAAMERLLESAGPSLRSDRHEAR